MFFVTGDVHGNAWDLDDRMDELEDRLGRSLDEDDEILLLGDVGIRYGASENLGMIDVMRRHGARFVVMRGNHDIRYCRDLKNGMYGNGCHEVDWRGGKALVDDFVDNVLYLPDEGGWYPNDGHPFLIIPGAFSVDGYYRQRMYMPFEREEQLTAAEMDRIIDLSYQNPVEHVFSHTCPYGWLHSISDLFLGSVRQESVDKSMERMMDVVLNNVCDGIHDWWFGHYHDDRRIPGTMGHMLYCTVAEVPDI